MDNETAYITAKVPKHIKETLTALRWDASERKVRTIAETVVAAIEALAEKTALQENTHQLH